MNSDETLRAETSLRLAAWDPETMVGLLAVRYVFPKGYHQTDSEEYFRVEAAPVSGITFGAALKGEPVWEEGLAQYYDETTLLLEFRTAPGLGPTEFSVTAFFQICDEQGVCLFPDREEHNLIFDPDATGFEADAASASVLSWVRSGEDVSVADTSSTAAANSSVLFFLLLALAGGVLLNLMPCVLPLLSVKALNLVQQAGQNKKAILAHAWLYVAGIETTFLILAAVVIVLKASGTLLGWGFQFQSPLFVLILIAGIWVFALSLFDVFVIEPPKGSLRGASAAGGKKGYLGSFLTGMFAVLVATPCTAPFLGAALGFAFSRPPGIITAIFLATGFGLSLPFLILGLKPSVIAKLPKPGTWMNTFKQFMGFLLAGTAVYLITTFRKLAPAALSGLLWWLLFLGLASWILGWARRPLRRSWIRIAGQIVALSLALGSGFLLIDLDDAAQESYTAPADNMTIPFDEAGIRGLLASGEPVFLEFTADWCTTCKVNQRVLKSDDVQTLMTAKGVTYVKGDLTSYDETMTRWLSDFGRAGVPLYVLFPPGGEARLLPELLTLGRLKEELESLPDL